MSHDILVTKLYAYGMYQETVTLLASYLRNRKQRVKVGNCESDWEPLSKCVPQRSVMGSILFNLFLNDIVFFIKNSSLTNYADDNTLIDFAKTQQELISQISEEGEVCLDWFSRNVMQENPTKFQLMMNNHKTICNKKICNNNFVTAIFIITQNIEHNVIEHKYW